MNQQTLSDIFSRAESHWDLKNALPKNGEVLLTKQQAVFLDIQQRNLDISKLNLFVNYQMGNRLNALTEKIDSNISDLNFKLQKLSDCIERKEAKEEYEDFAREIIFNFNNADEYLSTKSDRLFIALEAKKLLLLLDSNNINTQAFTQIQDKEYFSKVRANLLKKFNSITNEEKEEIDNFSQMYFYTLNLIGDLNSSENIKIENFPDDFVFIGMPEKPMLLAVEDELNEEIKSPYMQLGLATPNLRRYISEGDELPTIFEDFYQSKKNYEMQCEEYNFSERIRDLKARESKYLETLSNALFCQEVINDYLHSHSEFLEIYPTIQFSHPSTEILNYEELLAEHKSAMQRVKENLAAYYANYKVILDKKMSGELFQENEKLKKKKNMTVKKYLAKQRRKKVLAFFFIVFFVFAIYFIKKPNKLHSFTEKLKTTISAIRQ